MRRMPWMEETHSAPRKINDGGQRIVCCTNHRMGRKIVEMAKGQNAVIKLENLSGIRNNKKHTRSFNYTPTSWSFYQLQQFTGYKAELP